MIGVYQNFIPAWLHQLMYYIQNARPKAKSIIMYWLENQSCGIQSHKCHNGLQQKHIAQSKGIYVPILQIYCFNPLIHILFFCFASLFSFLVCYQAIIISPTQFVWQWSEKGLFVICESKCGPKCWFSYWIFFHLKLKYLLMILKKWNMWYYE